MFMRNLLKSGNYVVLVPAGLPVTLEYDDDGKLRHIYHGLTDQRTDITNVLRPLFAEHKLAPMTIGVKNGYTYVQGCLHTKQQITGVGDISKVFADYILTDIVEHPTAYTLYTANVHSTVVVFRGAMPIRQWLNFNKFNVLPGYLITTTNNTIKGFEQLVKRDCPFSYPLFTNAFIFGSGDAIVEDYRLTGAMVKSVSLVAESTGQLVGNVILDGGHKLTMAWHDVVVHNIYEQSWVVLDREEIIYAWNPSGTPKRTYITDCPVCGKRIKVPTVGLFTCDDEHCNSRLYPRVCQLLEGLKLPGMTYERYLKVTRKQGNDFDILDVLDLPEYKSTQIVASLPQVLSAVIPFTIIPNANLVQILCNHCNNSIETLDYYLAHPDKLLKDFELEPAIYTLFTNWISDARNYMDVHSILHSDRVQISDKVKRFDGAPIFRDRTIMITGDFHHGTHSEVQTILASYQANAITTFDENATCLIIGGLHDHINGNMIAEATAHNIPVFEEIAFFDRYGIDDDLRVNL